MSKYAKEAVSRYPIHPLLRWRWSPRAFSPQPVEAALLASLFEAARWAPSSYNEQPWHYILATRERPEDFEKLLSCLIGWNQSWARSASVLALSVARLHFSKNGQVNRHAFHDVGLATAQLVVQATALDLYVHQMAGFDPEKARELFRIPEGFEPVAALAIGYLGDPDSLPEPLRERERAPRSRRPLEDFLFSGAWGQSWPLPEEGAAGPAEEA